ncbi:hypothetical protein PLESTF_001013600 [Pleodorina starrii]|nr:hypothetical protein PLESTF_001013600 [Pleodorina starrii]
MGPSDVRLAKVAKALPANRRSACLGSNVLNNSVLCITYKLSPHQPHQPCILEGTELNDVSTGRTHACMSQSQQRRPGRWGPPSGGGGGGYYPPPQAHQPPPGQYGGGYGGAPPPAQNSYQQGIRPTYNSGDALNGYSAPVQPGLRSLLH